MLRKIEKNAKNANEALKLAAEEFGVPVTELSYKVEREVGKGLMGFLLGREVIISAWITKEAEAEEEKLRKAAEKRDAIAAKEDAKNAVKARAAAQAAEKLQKNERPTQPKTSPSTKTPPSTKSSPISKNVSASKVIETPVSFNDKDDAPKTEQVKKNREVTEKSITDATFFVTELIGKMGFDDAKIEVNNIKTAINIDISGSKMGLLIGRRGETLDSVQYLTSLYVNRSKNSYIKINVNTEGYREKREDTLIKLAHGLERRVIKENKSITLEPMSPNERRIIHAALQNNKKIKTFSVGDEPNRKVVVSLNR
ncbi:MAG: RNA-binding cell elongation regulator Jag/EloR, partial [Oscillospiraceae bacterium]